MKKKPLYPPNLIQRLHELADNGHFPTDPPVFFGQFMGLHAESPSFLRTAWKLFKRKRRRVSREDVTRYLEHGKKSFLIGDLKSHFLDSGSFTLWTEADKYAKAHQGDKWGYYETPEFWQYVDDYAAFVKRYASLIDLYANVDVIPNPELTWRSQKYLEKKHGLKPIPVVHYTTDLKWLRHYVERGYEIIGLGGLVGASSHDARQRWLDRAFDLICDNPKRLPCVKLHGFGITRHDLMVRYPWWSLDSTRWAKAGGYGSILIPYKRNGKFDLLQAPFMVIMSVEAPARARMSEASHYLMLSKSEKKIIHEWLDEIGVPFGKFKGHEAIEVGVTTHHTERRVANLHYFERLSQAVPEWPWPFKRTAKKGLGIWAV